MGCYRRDDVYNPEVYGTALVAVFCEYTEAIVVTASDPRTGLPGKSKWFPTVAEVKQECDRLAAKAGEVERWHEREEERHRFLPPPDRSAERERIKAGFAETRAEMDRRGGYVRRDPDLELGDICRKYGVNMDSLKDAPGCEGPKRLGQIQVGDLPPLVDIDPDTGRVVEIMPPVKFSPLARRALGLDMVDAPPSTRSQGKELDALGEKDEDELGEG